MRQSLSRDVTKCVSPAALDSKYTSSLTYWIVAMSMTNLAQINSRATSRTTHRERSNIRCLQLNSPENHTSVH